MQVPRGMEETELEPGGHAKLGTTLRKLEDSRFRSYRATLAFGICWPALNGRINAVI